MDLAQRAADEYAHKCNLTAAPVKEDDAFWTASTAYAAALDKARHLKDAKLVTAVNAAQASFVQTMNSKPVGQKVKYGEFDATVMKICDGSLSGMLEIRVPGGVTCVGVTEVTRDRPGASEVDRAMVLTQYEQQNAAEKIDGYYIPTPYEDAQHNTRPAVERARAECIKALERQIEQISHLPVDKFFVLTGRKSGTQAKQSSMAIQAKRPQQHEIDAQVEVALQTIMRHGYSGTAVVGLLLTSEKNGSLGFHFEEGRSIGDIISNEDGSTFEVLATVPSTTHKTPH